MGALEDKARKARLVAKQVGSAARDTARRNASTAKVKLSPREERAAADKMRPTMAAERARTARRATAIATREAAKSSAKRVAAATGNIKSKAAPKPTKTPLSKSEEAFLAGQKKKAQITKRTGVYPNTAN